MSAASLHPCRGLRLHRLAVGAGCRLDPHTMHMDGAGVLAFRYGMNVRVMFNLGWSRTGSSVM